MGEARMAVETEQAASPAPAPPQARPATPALRGPPTPAAILALQRTAGNRAVARALARCAGRCTCGGACRDEDDLEEMRRPVLARFARGDKPSPGGDGGQDGGDPDSTSDDGGLAPDNPSREQDPNVTIGVCGPDITRPFSDTLTKMAADFGTWSPADKRAACKRIAYPLNLNLGGDGGTPTADVMGWDIHALYFGEAQWLRKLPVCPPCATPSSSAPPSAGFGHKGHEDPRTCSDTVQIGNACWLAGTPNYATLGMILRICDKEFSAEAKDPNSDWPSDFLDQGRAMVRGYKLLGPNKEDPKWPLAWMEAVFRGGASTTLPGGNRQSCTPTCSKVNPKIKPESLANWDYVWEPAHPRFKAPAPAPSAPAPADAGVP